MPFYTQGHFNRTWSIFKSPTAFTVKEHYFVKYNSYIWYFYLWTNSNSRMLSVGFWFRDSYLPSAKMYSKNKEVKASQEESGEAFFCA